MDKKIAKNLKHAVVLSAAVASVLGLTGIAASASQSGTEIKSHGVFEYDINGDGKIDDEDILLDARDLNTLSEKISQVESEKNSDNAALTSAIASERNERISAIEQEAANRTSAIDAERGERTSAIEQEIADRTSAIGQETSDRTSAINAEKNARTSAIEQEITARENAVSAEKEARTSADKSLEDKISAVDSSMPTFNLVNNGGIYTLEITDPRN